jgi:hypothetical protein
MQTREPNLATPEPVAPPRWPSAASPAQPEVPRPLLRRVADAVAYPGAIEYASWLQLLRHLGA